MFKSLKFYVGEIVSGVIATVRTDTIKQKCVFVWLFSFLMEE